MTKKVSAKPVNKAAKKKTTKVAKKTIAKKPTTKKVVSKKTATKKVPAEKVPIRRTASKKSVEKKMVTVSPQIEENLDLGLVETYKSEAIEVMPEEKETAIDAVEMMETAVLVGAERADLEDEDLEYFVQPEVTVESDTQLTVTLSATLLKKLTSAAEEEGVSTDQFATELITEGVVLRAWEIIERKAAMRGPSYNQNTKPQGPRNNNHRSSGSSSSSSSSNSSSSSSSSSNSNNNNNRNRNNNNNNNRNRNNNNNSNYSRGSNLPRNASPRPSSNTNTNTNTNVNGNTVNGNSIQGSHSNTTNNTKNAWMEDKASFLEYVRNQEKQQQHR